MAQTELAIRTVTPLWTGGVPGTPDVNRLHGAGVIGGLRWWYEALIRGVGGYACDLSAHSCIYDRTAPAQGLCDACRLFGATGWRRRFRLIADEGNALRPGDASPIKASPPRSRQGRTPPEPPQWFFNNGKPLGAPGSIAALKLVAAEPTELAVIEGLIQFVAARASLGAKPQMGFGLVDVEPPQDTQPLLERLRNIQQSTPDPTLPSLRDMFFAQVLPGDGSPFPSNETFNLKYDLRQKFRGTPDTLQQKALRHFIMGTTKGQHNIRAKVMLSRPFNRNMKMRVWGWIPVQRREGNQVVPVNRTAVIQTIEMHLNGTYRIDEWREFNSARDSSGQVYTDINLFLRSLLEC